MKNLSQVILELVAISLGVYRFHYCKFFEDGRSIMRGNNYPPCREAGLTFGTGPHSDPNSLTILHQDQVGGLEIFSDNKWLAVRPRPDAFVVNIGDTFMVRIIYIRTYISTIYFQFIYIKPIMVSMSSTCKTKMGQTCPSH